MTDVAAEMDALTDTLRECKICHKACVAAVEMLAVRTLFYPSVEICELNVRHTPVQVQKAAKTARPAPKCLLNLVCVRNNEGSV